MSKSFRAATEGSKESWSQESRPGSVETQRAMPVYPDMELKFDRLSIQTVPTLQDLVIESVLRNEALPIPNLEHLPWMLILQLYREAIMGGHMELIKKMVLSCPLACLRLWSLLETRNIKALKTLLGALDLLILQKVQPRQWKLKALDFRAPDGNRPNTGFRTPLGTWAQEATSPKEGKICGRRKAKPRLRIFLDFQFGLFYERFFGHLRHWVQERQAVAQIYAEKLTMCWDYLSVHEFLSFLPLYYIRELEVDALDWTLDMMEHFLFYVAKMRNLQVFRFSFLNPRALTSRSQNRRFSHKYSLQLRKMKKLQEISISHVFFLYGTLHKILQSHTPLKTLRLRCSPLKESDLKHLSLCPSTNQLKFLDLSHFSMKDMSPEPLRVLLEKVADTLETLILEFCKFTESQVKAISPTLGRCSQLRTFHFFGNQIPLSALKHLLSHTARLPLLADGRYPAPNESYDKISWVYSDDVNDVKFDQVRRELMELVKEVRPVHTIQIHSFDSVLHLKHTDCIA